MTNLTESQEQEQATRGNIPYTKFSKDELAKKGLTLCIMEAQKTHGDYGWQWTITIRTLEGEQKLWFSPASPPDSNPKKVPLSKWDKVFGPIDEWPQHGYKLIKEADKYWKFVAVPGSACGCSHWAEEEDAEAEVIIQEVMGDMAEATPEQMQALITLAASMRVEWPEGVSLTVGEWKNSMRQLALKQAGLA